MSIIDNVRNMHISDYNYTLPDERIAKHPLQHREQCKLLYYKAGEPIKEYRFFNIPQLLPQHSILVYNNTRVINARLRFQKETGSLIEIFCLEPVFPHDYEQIFQATGSCTWLCLVGNSKRWKQGPLSQQVCIDGRQVTLSATRGTRRGNSWEITFAWDGDGITFASILDGIGEIPIPPYLNRKTEASDSTDYQTVYSHIDGSVAAPTAGLHFTDDVLADCDKLGIKRRELTLHVGAGTFQPVKSENLAGHEMHTEFISVPKSLLVELAASHDPVVAVGTTSVRTLESLYYVGQILQDNPDADEEQLRVTQWMPYTTPCDITAQQALLNIVNYLDRHHAEQYTGSTQLMIAPGFTYRIISGMVTNFHQPQSTLLLLVSAFVGDGNWRDIYRFALDNDFRFLSYGDASLLLK